MPKIERPGASGPEPSTYPGIEAAADDPDRLPSAVMRMLEDMALSVITIIGILMPIDGVIPLRRRET